jgi:DNA-binding PadR family transcriptional regulator
VGLTVFQALEKAIEAGGINLAAKAIAGASKQLLDELCSSGFLSKTGGTRGKYNVTPEGRAAWEREAPADHRRQIIEREEQQHRKSLVEFLTLVQKKSGAPLTNPEIKRFPSSLRQTASEQHFVEPGTKANSYLLSPEGEDLVHPDQALDRRIQRMRDLHHQTLTQWRAGQHSTRRRAEWLRGQ